METAPLDPRDAALDLTGRELGAYTILRRLGRGGMADVYLAEQRSLRRYVAIKVLKPSLAQNANFVKRFHHEAQAAAALVQSNIVQIYEVGESDGVHFIAQEYVRGQNLRQYLNRHGAVDPIVAVNIIRQVAAALQKAAEHNVIHRDIKPENIMLAPTGEVKVTDFGLARVNDPERRSDLTQIGITMGTPLYMSPEQVEGGAIDPRSDLYSLGVTAYHMLAGTPPFDGDNPLAVALQHVNKIPPPLTEVRPDVPAELSAIVQRMIAKRPADRFQDPAELSRAIRKIEIDFDQWDELIDKLASDLQPHADPALSRVSATRYVETRTLQTVMTGHLRPAWTRPAALLVAALFIAVGIVVGSVWALTHPPSDPLQVADDVIPKQANAQQQFRYAYWHPELRDRAWLAVREYFGDAAQAPAGEADASELLYIRLADERLAEYYLQNGLLEKARGIYSELANVEPTETRFRSVGHLGLAVVCDAVDQPQQVRDHLLEVEKNMPSRIRDRFQLNGFLNRHYDRLIEKYGAGHADATPTGGEGETGGGPRSL